MREEYNIVTARKLRRAMTDVERLLWYRLRDRRLKGAKFRRQLPIGPYVADFACMDVKRVVELDGGQHATNIEADVRRDTYMCAQGFTVLRFWNNEVKENIDGVLMRIIEHMPAPHPNLLPQAGEGTSQPSLAAVGAP